MTPDSRSCREIDLVQACALVSLRPEQDGVQHATRHFHLPEERHKQTWIGSRGLLPRIAGAWQPEEGRRTKKVLGKGLARWWPEHAHARTHHQHRPTLPTGWTLHHRLSARLGMHFYPYNTMTSVLLSHVFGCCFFIFGDWACPARHLFRGYSQRCMCVSASRHIH